MDLIVVVQGKKGRLIDGAIGLGLAMPCDFARADFTGMPRAASCWRKRWMPADVKTDLTL